MTAYGSGLYGAGLYGGSAITTSTQSVFPPRVLITLAGMVADNIVTVTVYRQIGTERYPLRGAINVAVTGIDSLVRIDGEQPFGAAYSYVAVMVDTLGNTYEAYSASLTVSLGTRYVASDAVTAIGARVVAEKWPDRRRGRKATRFDVGGRAVVVSGPRRSASSTLILRTDTAAEGDAMSQLLDEATSGVILVREENNLAGFTAYLAVIDDGEDRQWYGDVRWWSLDVIETESWPAELEARGFTLQDIADFYGTSSTLFTISSFATLLTIAQAEF